MDAFFPLITRRLHSDQDPLINGALEKMIARCKKIFKIQGRSESWKKVKKKTETIIRERKQGYLNYQVEKAEERGGLGNRFASLTKPLRSVDKQPNFDVKTLCTPGASDKEAAEECADYFSAISDEFVPLDMSALPVIYSKKLRRGLRNSRNRGPWFQGIFSPSLSTTTPLDWPFPWKNYTMVLLLSLIHI